MTNQKPAVALFSLGCKLNQAEMESAARQFSNEGYSLVDEGSNAADVYILNTCTVTHIADRKSRHMVRMWRRNNPDALIAVTGCYAERAAADLASAGADIVIGNKQKPQLFDIINDRINPAGDATAGDHPAQVTNRVRSFIKIQDGCRHYCSYCIVPLVRNPEYSVPAAEILDQVKDRTVSGYREIVLTGTRPGTYNDNGIRLQELIGLLLQESTLKRLHVSSLQPDEISETLIGLWSDTRLCRHFHLALQSGSDTVLKRMNRGYSTKDYSKVVSLIRDIVPDASITADIMVGFPGETDEEFEASYQFCRSMRYAAIHVFPYSPRPGTKATAMTGQVPDATKKARSLKMLALSRRCSQEYQNSFIGRELEVLWEGEEEPGSGIFSGLSNTYIRLLTRSCEPLDGTFQRVKPVQYDKRGLWV
jgi:threonylcarbamoyladenosine tRNA methylthiotransferase MtaB